MIESVRARLEESSLRPGLLAEKGAVYDGLIESKLRGLQLDNADARPTRNQFDSILALVQRQQGRELQERLSRRWQSKNSDDEAENLARLRETRQAMSGLWRERLRAEPGQIEGIERKLRDLEQQFLQAERRLTEQQPAIASATVGLQEIQASLEQGDLLLVIWVGRTTLLRVWTTKDAWGLSTRSNIGEFLGDVKQLRELFSRPATRSWREMSSKLGNFLLSGIEPLRRDGFRHLVVVADRVLQGLPFEALGWPGQDARLLVQAASVSYLPSVAMALSISQGPKNSAWRAPWETYAVALADPLSGVTTAGKTRFSDHPELPYAQEEVRAITALLPDTTEAYVGVDARKEQLLKERGRPPAVLHLATHAVANLEDSDRSRILLAPLEPEGEPEYLFLGEVADLDLSGVDLVTLSACETERGRVVKGEGLQAFSPNTLHGRILTQEAKSVLLRDTAPRDRTW